jgi:5-dehydro-4-deoxyglucarate dehydratase
LADRQKEPAMMSPAELKQRLQSVVAFAPTPFRAQDLEIDFRGFRDNMDYLAQSGVPWIAVAGFVGEYSALIPQEYSALIRTAADVVRGRSGIIAGVGGGTNPACEAARAAQESGADCAMILPPYLVQPTPSGLLEYFRAVAGSVRIGVMIHSMPGIAFAPDLIEQAADISNIVSYKDEIGDLRAFDETVSRIGDRLVYVNGKAEMMMIYFFLAGATCNATAIGNFDPQLALAAARSARERKYEEVKELLLPKARSWYRLREKNRAYLISLTKASMDLAGLCGGAVRPPLSEISPEDKHELRCLMDKLGYIDFAKAGARRV